MEVVLADVMGMCFGVRDALKVANAIHEPHEVTIHGELVHNEVILTDLRLRGFRMVDESNRQQTSGSEATLITAHGISNAERTRLQAGGRKLIDTTCPLVVRAHRAAQQLQEDGFHVLVIGKRDHVEVRGIVEDLDVFDIIEGEDDVRAFPYRRLGIMCQTTTPPHLAQRIRELVAQHNPDADIRFIDTVCQPTKDHQAALERLLSRVQVVIVVGGRNSNNTRELVTRCESRGIRAFHVQSAADLQPEWFRGVDKVGLTAGASTSDQTIAEVRQALLEIE